MTRRLVKWLLLVLALGAAAMLAVSKLADRRPGWSAPISSAERYSKASFDRWLGEDPARREGFAAFEDFLASRGVDRVVPHWQLLRTDANDRIGCLRPAFLLPPRADWPHIVPALRLLKNHVIPAIGPVEVVSAYRTAQFNACVGGASQSRHLGFSAVDLVATAKPTNRALFSNLCRLHARLGPGSRFGLGAYFDPNRNADQRSGRFHVDATGYRSWGYSKKAGSSGCRLLSL